MSLATLFRFLLWTLPILFNIFSEISAQNSSYEEDEASIQLFYYPNTQNSSERHSLDLSSPSSFQNANLGKGKRAKILIHGVNGNCGAGQFPHQSIEAYLQVKATGKEDYNVFCLDYQKIGKLPFGTIPGNDHPSTREYYEYAVNIVGNKTARFIIALEENGIVSRLEQVHVIGHSLGGQVSGVTGRKVLEMVNFERQLGRITGLDVMNIFNFGVYSNEMNLQNQIDSSDAKFVDIVHTNDGQIGLKGDYGRVDYYPDGGQHQKACLNRTPLENWIELLTGGCSHGIVGMYWAFSITIQVAFCKASSYEDYHRKKNASECTETNSIAFGEHVPLSAFGKFYFDTA